MPFSHRSNLLYFSFAEIKRATNKFSSKNRLGGGRLGTVYRGNLCKDGCNYVFAVKRFHKESEITFQNEIGMLSSVHHKNIIDLIGYCEEEDKKILVYEFMPNGSLHEYLFKNGNQTLQFRVEACLAMCAGVAKALAYLHSSTQIVHGNLRDDNILLDGNLIAKISNFGLSRTLAGGPSTSPQNTSHLQGKDGFLAPECYEPNYKPHMKADAYAFGVVLLGVLCDWPKRQVILTTLPYITKGELHRFFTEYVQNNSSLRCLTTCESIIRDCLEYDPANRPSMNQVVDKLKLGLALPNEQFCYDRIVSGSEWSCKKFSLEGIKTATNDFAMDNLLGEGAFWKSYRGCILGYKGNVCVKRINKSEHGISVFQSELVVLQDCNHVNIISLVGYCLEKNEKIIVYKFMPNGSLYDYLYNDQYDAPRLTVKQRLDICIGVAQGLSYLHEEIQIIHYNLSSDNIMLDHDLAPRISGIGNLIKKIFSFVLNCNCQLNFTGNEGYIAPECYEPYYRPSQKTDVFAFGILLLEVLCEKPTWKSLVILALEFAMKGELPRFRHGHLEINISRECSRACENLIRDCLDIDPDKRPSMKQVVDELRLALTLQENYRNGKANSQQSSQLYDQCSSSSCESFLLSDIAKATNDFSHYLGKGAFGEVYSGNISGNSYNGKVAVKRMTMEPEQGIPAFKKEIELVSSCNHVNVISLVGFCEEEDERILLYELMPNGSLYDYLYKDKDRVAGLTIEQRPKICIGVAKGLDYLHSGTDYVIIHSDLKTDNILLDQNLVPKISDFGLSRTRDAGPSTSEQITNHVQGIVNITVHQSDANLRIINTIQLLHEANEVVIFTGTEGYLAPECKEPKYKLSRKADIYAYGVLLLEVLCERRAWESLVSSALPFIMRGELPDFTPKNVVRHISPRCLRACRHLIMDCLDIDQVKRPDMNQVVMKLEEALRLHKKSWEDDHPLSFTNPKVFSSSSDRAVLYHDSDPQSAVLNRNQELEETLAAQLLLGKYKKRVEDRNVLLNPLFTDQLQNIFEQRMYSLPQLFIGLKHIGGLKMIRMLDKNGTLQDLFARVPDRDYPSYCFNCGNRRFVSCFKGNCEYKKYVSRLDDVCRYCNANGQLVRCSHCCFWVSEKNIAFPRRNKGVKYTNEYP